MQSWCDFPFKCLLLLTSVQSKWGKHSFSWDRLEDVFFQTQQERTPFGSTKKTSGWLIFASYVFHKFHVRTISCFTNKYLEEPIFWGSSIQNSLGSQGLIEKYGAQLACALKIQTSNYLHYFFIFPVIKHWLVIMPKGLIIPARNSSSLTTPLPRENLYTDAKGSIFVAEKNGNFMVAWN